MSIAVIYWSQTGNTEAMANAIFEGAKSAGKEVELFNVADIDAAKALEFDVLALGCPSMGVEVLEEAEFEPFMESIESGLEGKKVVLFGSYGWGDGQWMRDWEERVKEAKAELVNGEGYIVNETPEEDAIAELKELGASL